ncbi:hypothetical protein [Streptomyces hydrogenans]
MPMWVLTATSRTGQPVNTITGAPTDSVNVYSQEDLDRRLAAAKSDPRDLETTVRRVS